MHEVLYFQLLVVYLMHSQTKSSNQINHELFGVFIRLFIKGCALLRRVAGLESSCLYHTLVVKQKNEQHLAVIHLDLITDYFYMRNKAYIGVHPRLAEQDAIKTAVLSCH